MATASGPAAPTWPDLYAQLLAREDLSASDAAWAMDQVMSGEATPVQLAGFLMALRAKGESVQELRGLADAMLDHAVPITVPGPTVDIVGTGGDRRHTVNISTMSAIVVAATGRPVVKHGNRASSSSSGAADVLETLGVNLTLSPAEVAGAAHEVGITFCFANQFHPSMRHAAVARRELGIGTTFNALGPLTNPARPAFSAIGVAEERLAPLVAGVFAGRGRSAAVFRGDEGLDEMSVAGGSSLWWVRDGVVSAVHVEPEAVGVARHPIEALRGGDPAFNAAVVRRVLDGQEGAPREAVLLNAGTAIAVAAGVDAAPGETASAEAITGAIAAGVAEAAAAIDSGAASTVLRRWVAYSNPSANAESRSPEE